MKGRSTYDGLDRTSKRQDILDELVLNAWPSPLGAIQIRPP